MLSTWALKFCKFQHQIFGPHYQNRANYEGQGGLFDFPASARITMVPAFPHG